MHHVPSRRSFLKTMGSVGCAVPFARLLESSIVRAADAPPKRLLVLVSPHGRLAEYWRPKAVSGGFTLDFENSMLKPLEAWKHKLVVLDGIDYRVLYEKGNTGHSGGACTFLTGTSPVGTSEDLYPTGPSLDQVVANELGTVTPRKSIELGVYRQGGTTTPNSFIFGDGGTRIQSQIDPAAVYTRLFGSLTTSDGGDAEAARRLARKESLVTYLSGQANRLRGRLAGEERVKLDSHIDALAAIEHRLHSEQTAILGCDPGDKPATIAPQVVANIPTLIDLQFDLITQAFACDLTRVASFHFLQTGDETPMEWIGLNTDIHNNIAHLVGMGNTEVDLKLVKVQQWYATKVAELFARLDAITDPQGGTILDNTVVLWGNELGQPSDHSSLNIPMILAGGGAGAFATGRHLEFSTSPDPSCTGIYGSCPDYDQYRNQTAHNQVLTSIAQMFGIEANYFGDPKYTGTLPGLV